ncbi:tRNA-specific adenosine deaminase 1 isoform X5 [Rattus norvegicus]|uniref:tRNA-specific adenosine deaminase 1 isoform X5 n=1 Tax=Rattus norvegicus TaxID=10116 RepID=UPI002FD87276
MWTADEIAQLCYAHYIKLPKQGKPEPNREWTLLAAVVKIQTPANQACDTPDKQIQVTKEVVSMGTGTKCIGQSKMRESGDILNDSHAEVIARRSFQRCQETLVLPRGFEVQELKIQQSSLLFEQSRCAVHRKRGDSPGRLVPCGAAISWSAVPQQPLDVTANGFPQGTTKKEIGSPRARSRISKVELFRSFQKLLSCIAEDERPDSVRSFLRSRGYTGFLILMTDVRLQPPTPSVCGRFSSQCEAPLIRNF